MPEQLLFELSDPSTQMDGLFESVARFATLHLLPPGVQKELHLVLDELLSNVVRHGYGQQGPYRITVSLGFKRGVLRLEITDDAGRFNPLDAPEPDLGLPLADRPVGGLGILLVKRLMDELKYSRVKGRNRLVMKRRVA
jgi:serine/threonine-protein kinase RsbW